MKLVKRKTNGQIETDYLFSSPANAAHLMESIAQLKAGKEAKPRKLIVDETFENMPPVGRELI